MARPHVGPLNWGLTPHYLRLGRDTGVGTVQSHVRYAPRMEPHSYAARPTVIIGSGPRESQLHVAIPEPGECEFLLD